MYPNLFAPGRIGPVQLKNRLVMAAMGTGLANFDGTPSEDMIAWYEARAQGGCGLIVTEGARVDDRYGITMTRQLSLTQPRNLPALARLAACVHRYDTKIFCQLLHPGRQTSSGLLGGEKCVGASAKMCKVQREPTRPLETAEVQALVQAYVNAAQLARQAGFDGVELHCAHGYLPQQFLSPYTNDRTDQYGGSFENRLRFVTEILAGIAACCGSGFAVMVRLSVDELLARNGVTEDYIHLQDGVAIARALEQAGAAAIDVSCTLYETGACSIEPPAFAEGWRTPMIRAVKQAVGIPVVAVNNLRTPSLAEQMLAEGTADFAALGRPWIADPAWGRKVLEGREAALHSCINCLRCFDTLGRNGQPPECSVNPRAFKERRYAAPKPDLGRHRLAVVGGGPAGCEAARAAAQRGMQVTLFEQGPALGGELGYACNAPHKQGLAALTARYASDLAALGVDVRLNTPATVEAVAATRPDAVILATGAKPARPAIPGAQQANVYDAEQVLRGQSGLQGQPVVVAGSGGSGLECAAYLCARGCQVTVVESMGRLAPGMNRSVADDYALRLQQQGVTLLLRHKLTGISAQGAELLSLNDRQARLLPCSAVVLATGLAADNSVTEEMKAAFANVYTVGAMNDPKCMISGAVGAAYACVQTLFAPAQPSFKLPAGQLQRFMGSLHMYHQEGVAAVFTTRPEVIARILPPPLRPFMMPAVTFTLYKVCAPNFTESYYEATLGLYCTHKGKMGLYPLSLLLCGPGQESPLLVGREFAAWPKKYTESCVVSRQANGRIIASVNRHGTELIRLVMRPGAYNHPMMDGLYQAPAPGKDTKGTAFCFKLDTAPNEDGSYSMPGCQLLGNLCNYHYHSWQPCYVESVQLRSSSDDPWGELEVDSAIGGAYAVNDLFLGGSRLLAQPDVQQVLPYIMTQRYDRNLYNEVERL